MQLRIGLLAPPWVPVPPTVYGGIELALDVLARGLQEAGCDVLLFTTGDATCPVPRSWHYELGLGTAMAPRGEIEHVEHAYATFSGHAVDIVHDHTLMGPVRPELHAFGIPVVTTAHGELTSEMRTHYARATASGAHLVAISHAQRRSAPELPVSSVIHHGVEVETYPFGDGDGGYVLFLGRMTPEKGAHVAIDVARAAGRPLRIAAKMWEESERRHFTECIEPMLGEDVTYVGTVGGREKLELIAGAEALLNPIRWPEPFGLVMIEALVCGTPVLTFPEGAAPEIVDHGRTGFLCEDEADMVARLDDVARLDRGACRAAVADRFSATRVVERHLELYEELVAHAR